MDLQQIALRMNTHAGNNVVHEVAPKGDALIVRSKNGGPHIKLALDGGDAFAFAAWRRADIRFSPWQPIEGNMSTRGILRRFRKLAGNG